MNKLAISLLSTAAILCNNQAVAITSLHDIPHKNMFNLIMLEANLKNEYKGKMQGALKMVDKDFDELATGLEENRSEKIKDLKTYLDAHKKKHDANLLERKSSFIVQHNNKIASTSIIISLALQYATIIATNNDVKFWCYFANVINLSALSYTVISNNAKNQDSQNLKENIKALKTLIAHCKQKKVNATAATADKNTSSADTIVNS